MHRLLRTIADVRPKETRLTLLMGGYYFTLLITYYLLKPARDSLFLVELGAEQLPIVFIAIAFVVAPVVRLHSWAARRLSMGQLVGVATVVLAASLVALWAVLGLPGRWLFYVFYIWVSIYGALIVSQFWLFANYVFTASQARRLFVLLNVGAMLGAFVGGEVANGLVEGLGFRTQDLLLVTAVVLVASLGFVYVALQWAGAGSPADKAAEAAANGKAPEPSPKTGLLDTLAQIRGSWLLTFIVAIIALEMMTSTFVDYQFKAVTLQAFPDEAALTGFLATFYGRVSLIALLFQLFVLPRLLRNYGIVSALLLMPVGLLVGTIVLFIVPGLWAAVLLRGTDQSFEHSADKVGRELLFLPISIEVKAKVKVFIDVVVDRGFRGLAGGLLLLLVSGFGMGVRGLAVVTVVFILGWLVSAVCARRSYTDAFERALHQGQLEMTTTWTRTTGVDRALYVLEDALRDADDWRLLYALRALETHTDERIVDAVRPLLRYPSRDVRRQAIETVDAQEESPDLPEMEERLLDEDPAIQRAAFQYQFSSDEAGAERLLNFLREREATDLLEATASCVVYFGDEEQQACLDCDMIDYLIEHGSPSLRTAVAEVLGDRRRPATRAQLRRLAHDEEAIVRRAAVQSMGASGDEAFIEDLISLLGDDDVHVSAWSALARYGAAALAPLQQALSAPNTHEQVRRRLPRVLGTIPARASVRHLIPFLQCSDPVLRYNVTAALLRLRNQTDALSIPEKPVEEALDEEISVFYQFAQLQHVMEQKKKEPVARAGAAVAEEEETPDRLQQVVDLLQKRKARSTERIFQLLGLRYAQDSIRKAYDAYRSDEDDLQALAVEWLDNVLDPSLRQRLRPIIDPPSLAAQAKAGERIVGARVQRVDDALLHLLDSPDPEIQAHALRLTPSAPSTALRSRIQEACDDPNPDVRAAASEAAEQAQAQV